MMFLDVVKVNMRKLSVTEEFLFFGRNIMLGMELPG